MSAARTLTDLHSTAVPGLEVILQASDWKAEQCGGFPWTELRNRRAKTESVAAVEIGLSLESQTTIRQEVLGRMYLTLCRHRQYYTIHTRRFLGITIEPSGTHLNTPKAAPKPDTRVSSSPTIATCEILCFVQFSSPSSEESEVDLWGRLWIALLVFVH